MKEFENLVEETFYRITIHGEEEAYKWLDEELKLPYARKAVAAFIQASIESASLIVEDGDPEVLEEAVTTYKNKKKEVH